MKYLKRHGKASVIEEINVVRCTITFGSVWTAKRVRAKSSGYVNRVATAQAQEPDIMLMIGWTSGNPLTLERSSLLLLWTINEDAPQGKTINCPAMLPFQNAFRDYKN